MTSVMRVGRRIELIRRIGKRRRPMKVCPFEVGTPRCGVPGRVQRAELLPTPTIEGSRCAAERGADSVARCPYLELPGRRVIRSALLSIRIDLSAIAPDFGRDERSDATAAAPDAPAASAAADRR